MHAKMNLGETAQLSKNYLVVYAWVLTVIRNSFLDYGSVGISDVPGHVYVKYLVLFSALALLIRHNFVLCARAALFDLDLIALTPFQ